MATLEETIKTYIPKFPFVCQVCGQQGSLTVERIEINNGMSYSTHTINTVARCNRCGTVIELTIPNIKRVN